MVAVKSYQKSNLSMQKVKKIAVRIKNEAFSKYNYSGEDASISGNASGDKLPRKVIPKSSMERLVDLAKLKVEGAISQEEYDKRRDVVILEMLLSD